MVRDRSIELVRDGGLTAVLESIELDDAQAVLKTNLNVRAARPPRLTESEISELAMKLPHVVSIIDLRILRLAENRGVTEPCCERLRMQLPPDFGRSYDHNRPENLPSQCRRQTDAGTHQTARREMRTGIDL